MASDGRKLNQTVQDEHDVVEYRKRVQMWSDGNSVSYEDASFVTGDSPAVLDVFTDLGRAGHEGYLVNAGPGDISVEISKDGTLYGGVHTVRGGETLDLDNMIIHKIRLTWIDNTAFRSMIL